MFALYLCREHEEMMTKLRKVLVKSSKIRRNRRRLLNLQIQIFAWLVEFFSGLIFVVAASQPQNNISYHVFGFWIALVYWIAIPGIYLMNNDDFKSWVTENHLYIAFTNRFFSKSINTIDFKKDNDDTIKGNIRTNNRIEES